jgi:hypothetical protein
MTFIETWSGEVLWPLRPTPDPIRIEDIAHGLSNKCRYNGQCLFYSVAEHSVHMADWCLQNKFRGSRHALHALLHDAAEAYLPDVTSPIKPMFPGFKGCEDRLLDSVYVSLGINPPSPDVSKLVKSIDSRIILNERAAVLPNHRSDVHWGPTEDLEPLSGVYIYRWPPDEAYDNFMNIFLELTK